MTRVLWTLVLLTMNLSCRAKSTDSASDLRTLETKDFPNYVGSITCKPSEVTTIRTIDDLKKHVVSARDRNQNIRVISLSSPRSYSQVICPDKGGIILDMQAFDKLVAVDRTKLTAIVQPGLLVSELQEQLEPLGLTFPVSPDYSGVSIAGSVATGSHSSSLRIPSAVADWVEEIKLIDSNGEIRILGGKDLDTARIHLGLFGVVYEMTLRVVPLTKVKYGLSKMTDANLEVDVEKLVRAHDYARVMWFPSQQIFVIDHFDKVPMNTAGNSANSAWSSAPDISWLGDVPIGVLNSSQFAQCTAENLRAKTFGGTFKVRESDAKSPVGLLHKMIAGTCEPAKCPWDYGVKSRSVEIGFALDRVQEWITDVKALIAIKRACFPVLGLYMRFSKASKSAIGQASGRDSVVFEIHIPVTNTPDLEPSSEVYDEIVQMTLSKFDGRPHWAKNSQPYFADLGSKQYPEWETFAKLRQDLDPGGLFKSPFWRQIESKEKPANVPNCGVTRQCICANDLDCGPFGRCEPGVYFKKARVCKKDTAPERQF